MVPFPQQKANRERLLFVTGQVSVARKRGLQVDSVLGNAALNLKKATIWMRL